jgi:hypothetical protein
MPQAEIPRTKSKRRDRRDQYFMARPLQRPSKPNIGTFSNAVSAQAARGTWSTLRSRDQVVVQEGKGIPYEAVVDVLTGDATVVWIVPTAVGNRKAFHYGDDVVIEAMHLP